MIHKTFIEAVEDSPVITAVKDFEGLKRCFDSESKVVFILFGDICNIGDIVDEVKRHDKLGHSYISTLLRV